ncbi:MAG TPA: type II secretion system protein [Verrucomicrobiae bacterium]
MQTEPLSKHQFETATNCRRRHAGFALIELVVVVLTLLLLILAVAPALSHSRGPSQRMVCLNNLRQLMQATGMYALDNRDFLPYPNWGNSTVGWLYRPVTGQPPSSSDPASGGGLLWPFVKKTSAYRCPLDTPADPYWVQRANKLSTYVMNGAVCGYGMLIQTSHRLNQFKPEAYCLWEPDEDLGSPPIGAFAYNDASSFPDRSEGPGRRHAGGTAIGTFGGNAAFPSIGFFTGQQTGGPNLVWCNPGSSNGH